MLNNKKNEDGEEEEKRENCIYIDMVIRETIMDNEQSKSFLFTLASIAFYDYYYNIYLKRVYLTYNAKICITT